GRPRIPALLLVYRRRLYSDRSSAHPEIHAVPGTSYLCAHRGYFLDAGGQRSRKPFQPAPLGGQSAPLDESVSVGVSAVGVAGFGCVISINTSGRAALVAEDRHHGPADRARRIRDGDAVPHRAQAAG